MIDAQRLEQLRVAGQAADWPLAGEIYIELSLGARGSRDRFQLEALAPYVRLRDAEGLAVIAENLRAALAEPH